MAEQIVSPGVFTRENDQSFITQQPVTVGAAILGPTVKGPVEAPTVVTSYSEFKNKYTLNLFYYFIFIYLNLAYAGVSRAAPRRRRRASSRVPGRGRAGGHHRALRGVHAAHARGLAIADRVAVRGVRRGRLCGVCIGSAVPPKIDAQIELWRPRIGRRLGRVRGRRGRGRVGVVLPARGRVALCSV